QAFSDMSRAAGQLLESSEFRSAMELTRSGSRFFSALGTGGLDGILKRATQVSQPLGPAVRELSRILSSAAPLLQSMSRGDYGRAIAQLRKSGSTTEIADRLAMLEPLAGLTQMRLLKSLEGCRADLGRLAQIRYELDAIKKLENSARRLQQRFQHN